MSLPSPALALFQSLGLPEILILVVLALLLFGSSKIGDLARSVGRAKADFKRGEVEGERELEREQDEAALRRRARDLGIATEGKSADELRRDIAAHR